MLYFQPKVNGSDGGSDKELINKPVMRAIKLAASRLVVSARSKQKLPFFIKPVPIHLVGKVQGRKKKVPIQVDCYISKGYV